MSAQFRLVLGLLLIGFVVSEADAQGIGINFGGGRVRVGFGGGYYGGGYSGRWGSYGGGWGRGYGASWRAGPYAAGGAINPGPNLSGGPIEIASEADALLKYSLNEFPYEIKAGQVQRLQEDRAWVIEFDRGGDFGTASYSLIAGRYKFVATKEGWDLVHAKDQVGMDAPGPDLDNRRNPLPAAPVRQPPPPPLPLDDLGGQPETSPVAVEKQPTPATPNLTPAQFAPVTEKKVETKEPTPVTPRTVKIKPRNPPPPAPMP